MKNLRVMFIASIFMSFFISLMSCNNDEVYAELVQDSVIEEKVVEEEIVEETPTPEPEPEPELEPQPDLTLDVSGELKAFPSAEGAAKYVTGGRGYPVIHVTNLNDSGPGSLRAALGSNRTIVFDVSGTITTNSTLSCDNCSNLTIAGQTAPEGGITIKGYNLLFDYCSNIIVRYLRFRADNSKLTYGTDDNISFWWSNNIILDHVSVSYGADENMDLGNGGEGVDNITMQRCIIGEGKTGAMFQAGNPSSSGDITVYKNLFVNNHHRSPNISSDFQAEVINNVIYNWQVRISTVTIDADVNFINNYYKPGVMTPTPTAHFQQGNVLPDGGTQKIYLSGSYWEGFPNFTANNWLGWQDADSQNYRKDDQSKLQSTYDAVTKIAVPNPVVNIDSAIDAYRDVLANVGANRTLDGNGVVVAYIDSVDETHFADVINGTYVNQTNGNFQWYESVALDYGNPPSNTRPSNYDTDKDGMPDAWEVAKGFNPNADDANGDADGDGYTNLEEYLNLVDL